MTKINSKLIDDLRQLLKMLKLDVCHDHFQLIAERSEKEKLSHIEFLHE
jgi:hypothetical protein